MTALYERQMHDEVFFFVLNSLRCMKEVTLTPPTRTEKNIQAAIYHWLIALEYVWY